MSTSTRTWGTGANAFTLTYKDDEVITSSGNNSYMSNNFASNSFAAFQSKKLTQFFDKGDATNYNSATEDNCIWRKWDGNNNTDILTGTENLDGYFTSNSLIYNDGSNDRILTDISDIQRVIWTPSVAVDNIQTNINGTLKNVTFYRINTTYNQPCIDIVDATNPMSYTVQGIKINPWLLNPHDKTQLQAHFIRNDNLSPWGNSCERNSGSRFNGINNERYYPLSTAMVDYTVPNGNNQNFGFYSDDNCYLFHCTLSTNNYASANLYCYICDEDELKLYLASAGFKFIYKGVMYKPVVTGGVITGYTNDLSSKSEWDDWHTRTDHNIPVTPPSGGGGNGDELTDMLSRGQFYGSGLTKYYVDPPAVKLQKALGDWDNIATGKDVLQNLLSYKIMCFPSTTFSNGVTDPFVIAGTELKDENDTTITAKRLTSTGAVNLPNITITPTFNDFRDYAPYTKIQMFVPLCGWFDLPPWCMGRKIGGEMYINPYSGTVRCLVRADGNVVAELGGNAAIDLPFNATAVGMKSAAVLSNLIQTAGAVGRAVMLPTVNTLAGAGSAALGTVCALNANYTESKGTMGDGSNVYGLYNVYIKITRPPTVDNSGNSLVTIPTQYAHDYGRPCNKQLTLTAGDGYTQILDANITGTMTDREKQMIIDGFRHGLIL